MVAAPTATPAIQKPYAPFYSEKIIAALESLEKPDFRVLMALGAHGDEYGICFPGHDRLGRITRYAVDSMEPALLRLQNFGYIRILIYRNPVRRKTEVSFQISPHFYHVRPELQDQAWRIWHSAGVYENSQALRQAVTNYGQPASESTSESSSIINYSNQLQYPTSASASKQALPPEGEVQAPGSQPSDSANGSTNASTNANHNPVVPPAPGGATKSGSAARQPQSSPPVPPLPPLPQGAGNDPLPDMQDENAAKHVHAQFKGLLTIINARRAVLRFGRDKVLAAANVAESSPTAINPVGIMMNDLRKGLITPGVDGLPSVDWEKIRQSTFYANFQREWHEHTHLLERTDCPDWFRSTMAHYAEEYPQDGSSSADESAESED